MKPESITALIICCIIVISAFIIGILFDLELLSKNLWLSVIKNGGLLAALFFGLVHWIKSRPSILSFSSDSWKENKAHPDWDQLCIHIPESEHKKGKTPTVIFLSNNDFTKSQCRLVHLTDENGNITICHDKNSYMPPWEAFKVKITI